MSAKELRRLSNVRALWACRCHPYIESTDSEKALLGPPCVGFFTVATTHKIVFNLTT